MKKAKGDMELCMDLLQNSNKSYKEISEESGVNYATVIMRAKKLREQKIITEPRKRTIVDSPVTTTHLPPKPAEKPETEVNDSYISKVETNELVPPSKAYTEPRVNEEKKDVRTNLSLAGNKLTLEQLKVELEKAIALAQVTGEDVFSFSLIINS